MESASPAIEEELLSEFTSPALEELLPDLSPKEQLRLQNQSRERHRIWKRHNKQDQNPPPAPYYSERDRDFFMIPQLHHALSHYNATHPGGEFDAVKPLMQCRVGFRGHVWFHLNFWARSRSSTTKNNNKTTIKRFFAEVHYKPTPPSCFVANSPLPTPIPIVQVCTIIEEPLSQYRHSCAFCPGHMDIVHPKGRKFVCGNDKDRTGQRLQNCHTGIPLVAGMPFTGRPTSK